MTLNSMMGVTRARTAPCSHSTSYQPRYVYAKYAYYPGGGDKSSSGQNDKDLFCKSTNKRGLTKIKGKQPLLRYFIIGVADAVPTKIGRRCASPTRKKIIRYLSLDLGLHLTPLPPMLTSLNDGRNKTLPTTNFIIRYPN